MRVLCDARVQIVLDHCHYRSSLTAFRRVLVDRPCIHLVIRTETVHVDAAVVMQLLRKLLSQNTMELGREISESIAYSQYLFLVSKNVLALRRMVYRHVVWFFLRKLRRDAFEYLFLKISHVIRCFCLLLKGFPLLFLLLLLRFSPPRQSDCQPLHDLSVRQH